MIRTHLDLFSGIGGFALACRWCGIETIGFCEIEPYAQRVIQKNFGAIPVTNAVRCDGWQNDERKASPERDGHPPRLHKDIFDFNGAEYLGVWLVTGGFPCQPFSCAGKRRGKEDDRHLWPEMCRVIAEARPAWVLAENVPGIINMELDSVLSDMEGIGYTPWPIVVPACAVDARHRRSRVWIVAHDERQSIRTGLRKDGRERQSTTGSGIESCNNGLPIPNAGQRAGFRSESRTSIGSIPKGDEAVPSDAQGVGLQGQRASGKQVAGIHGVQALCDGGQPAIWRPEPDVCRVAHGIPRRVDRLKGLGNAIVPQVAAQLIAALLASENR